MNKPNFSTDEIREKVYAVVYEVSGIEIAKINDGLSIGDDIAPSSLDRVSLFMALEDEFATSVDEDEVQEINTVGDLIKFVEKKAKAAAS